MKENEAFNKNMILPYRNVPFDIGVRLDHTISNKVKTNYKKSSQKSKKVVN